MDKNIKKYFDIRQGNSKGSVDKTVKKAISELEQKMSIWFKLKTLEPNIRNTYKMQIRSIRKLYTNNKDKYYVILFYVTMLRNYLQVDYKNRQNMEEKIELNHSDYFNRFRQLLEEMVRDIRENVTEQELFNKLIAYLNYVQNPQVDEKTTSEKILDENNEVIEEEEVVVND